jgi:hypothetical protein
MVDPVGAAGALLVLAAWILETRKVVSSKDLEGLDIRFLIVYLIGSLTLAYYSSQTGDVVFMGLSSIISLLTLIEIVFVFIKRR